jgi:hypothetical protein
MIDQNLHGTPSTIDAFRNGTIPVLPPSLVELLRAQAAPAKPESNDPATPTPAPTSKTNGSSHTHALGALPGDREEAYADTALRNTINELAALAEGSRNIELNKCSIENGPSGCCQQDRSGDG